MNQAKLLTRIIRRQIEALAAIVAEAELAKDITESEAADLIAGAKVQFELISCKTTRDQKGRGDIASEPKNVEDVIMKLVAEVIGPEGMEEGGRLWRSCIRGEHGHPPRPDRVRRAMEIARGELGEGKIVDKSVTKYVWSIYKRLRD